MFINRADLISYVFTNPPGDTVLNTNDLVYVLVPPNRKWKDALARYNRKVRARSRRGIVWF